MMRYLIFTAVLTLVTLLSAQADTEIAVVVNSSSDLKELTRRQVIDIYMGRAAIVANGKTLVPYDQPAGLPIRAAFYHQLTGKSVAAVNAYWARLLFTGRASPPRQVSDSLSMLKSIEENTNAIGYIDIKDLNERTHIVFRINVDE